jgi:hypothetical protein
MKTNRRLAGLIIFACILLLGAGGIVFGRGIFRTNLPIITDMSSPAETVPPQTETIPPPVTAIPSPESTGTSSFDGQRALDDVIYQVDTIGNRAVGTPGHTQIIQWITRQLEDAGWTVQIQQGTSMDHPIQNIIAYRSSYENATPWIILGAHYDNRIYANQDPDLANRTKPVPGANDGASGVAVLLELARTLPKTLNERVWLVFWDAEDNGDIPGWDWLLGSEYFVANLGATKPDMMINIDMVGDSSLDIQEETNSLRNYPSLVDDVWGVANNLGYSQYFQPKPGFNMLDDHTPFLNAGIPAIDIIDFTYSYWHTTSDTPDKVSAQSLTIVGNVLAQWLIEKQH